MIYTLSIQQYTIEDNTVHFDVKNDLLKGNIKVSNKVLPMIVKIIVKYNFVSTVHIYTLHTSVVSTINELLIEVGVVSESRLLAVGLDRRGSVAVAEEGNGAIVGIVEIVVVGFEGWVDASGGLVGADEGGRGAVQLAGHAAED